MEIIALGHKNPDTDSMTAAMALADLKSKLGQETIPALQGQANPESAFVLDRFGLDCPMTCTTVAGRQVFLVDHSDTAQSPADLGQAELLGIVDHHKLGDITTSVPLEVWIWPVGCSCTVVKNMYDFHGVEIPGRLAGAMLCAILSDTVMFKSVTCTDQDRAAAKSLAKLAGVEDMAALGLEMFRAKSNVKGTPTADLLFRDYKDFEMNGKKIGVAQLEVIDLSILADIRSELLKEVAKAKAAGRHTVMLLLTDIMKEASELLVVSDEPALVEKAFNQPVKDQAMWLPGVMSRKKQVIPNLEKAFNG